MAKVGLYNVEFVIRTKRNSNGAMDCKGDNVRKTMKAGLWILGKRAKSTKMYHACFSLMENEPGEG